MVKFIVKPKAAIKGWIIQIMDLGDLSKVYSDMEIRRVIEKLY